MVNKLKDTTPRPRIGKTAKDTRMARLIDINQVVDEFNAEQIELETRVEALENAPAPVVTVETDGVTITGTGTTLDPLVAVPQTPTSEYTEAIVTITPTQTTYSDGRPLVASGILAMGTNPIELLPTPAVDEYYDYYGVLEFTSGVTNYTLLDESLFIGEFNGYSGTVIKNELIVSPLNKVIQFTSSNLVNEIPSYSSTIAEAVPRYIGEDIVLSTFGSTDPTLGNGTIRVKIYYKLVTFGA